MEIETVAILTIIKEKFHWSQKKKASISVYADLQYSEFINQQIALNQHSWKKLLTSDKKRKSALFAERLFSWNYF